MTRVITLLSDFGTQDGYLGAMKGVLASRAPGVQLLDLAHDIEPGNIAAASFALRQAFPEFPAATVHLGVVDPGVGSERLALAAAIAGQLVVAPDNGLLSGVLADWPCEAACALDADALGADRISPVFHGRDLFAPAAAALARGTPLVELGTSLSLERLVRLPGSKTERRDGCVVGVIQHCDRFGNLISNLRPGDLAGAEVFLGDRRVPLHRTYSDVSAGSLLAVVGSHGFYEIACAGGSAACAGRAGLGDVVTLRPPARS